MHAIDVLNAMNDAAYVQVAPGLFRPPCRAQGVEFLVACAFSASQELRNIEFTTLHQEAENFAVSALKSCAGSLFSDTWRGPEPGGLMRFNLGMIFPEREPFPHYLSSFENDQACTVFYKAIMTLTSDVFSYIKCESDLLDALREDKQPFFWYCNNGAARSAICLYLAHTTNVSVSKVLRQLKSRSSYILHGLSQELLDEHGEGASDVFIKCAMSELRTDA